MITSNLALLDTNVIVYAIDDQSQFFSASKHIIERGRKGEISLCISPQIMSEFYAIITDSKRVKKPLQIEEALYELNRFFHSSHIKTIYFDAHTIEILLTLLKRYTCKKQDIFDFQLVATMLAHQVSHLYTYNNRDFEKFTEITVLSPNMLVS